MLGWALRYLVVATAVAVVFAVLQGRDWARPEARQVSGERAHQRASDRQVDQNQGDLDEGDYHEEEYSEEEYDEEEYDEEGGDEVEYDEGDYDEDSSGESDYDEGGSEESDSSELEQIIDAGPQGHFMVHAVVNGERVAFMVDTGASHVVLRLEDARKLGFTAKDVEFTHQFESANGVVRAAPVKLREFRVGQLQLYDVDAFVNGGPLPISLLGMSFLERLSSYEVARGRLVLRW
jgi:clan AA aspartic protease (TIGR02281 family)